MNKESISEYYLERYVLGELPEEEKEEISRLASNNPELQAAINEIKASNQEILEFYPPHTIKAILMAQNSETSKKPPSLKFILTISSAAALLFLILNLPLKRQESNELYSNSEKEVTLVKGIARVDLSQTQLLVYRKLQDQVELLKDGEKAQAGDLLQLAYVSAEGTYGMIFSIDGRGFITLHFPEYNGESTKLEFHKQFLLSNAIELDDAPGFERFFFLTSDYPFNVNSILKEAQNMAEDLEKIQTQDLHLSENFNQYSILILKGEGL
jgi:hypothetical protein